MDNNLYEILEIPSDADDREIKRAYHRLARGLHPDKASSPEEAKLWEERFAQVSAAYNTLKDPAKRAEYNKTIQRDATPRAGTPTTSAPPRTATATVLAAGRSIPKPPPSTGAASGGQRATLGVTPEKIAIAQKAYARGLQFVKENNHLKAIEFFEAAIQNNDNEAAYHARLALSLIHVRKSAVRAIDAAQRAIDLEPYNLEHKFNLAYIYEAIGSKSNARKIYQEILRWDTGNTRATAAVAALKKGKGSFRFGLDTSMLKPGFLQQILDRFTKR